MSQTIPRTSTQHLATITWYYRSQRWNFKFIGSCKIVAHETVKDSRCLAIHHSWHDLWHNIMQPWLKLLH